MHGVSNRPWPSVFEREPEKRCFAGPRTSDKKILYRSPTASTRPQAAHGSADAATTHHRTMATYPVELAPGASKEGKVCVAVGGGGGFIGSWLALDLKKKSFADRATSTGLAARITWFVEFRRVHRAKKSPPPSPPEPRSQGGTTMS